MKEPIDVGEECFKEQKEAFRKNKRVHVISRGKRWGVFKGDKSRASRLYEEKEDAVNHAERIMGGGGYVVVVHQKEGTVEWEEWGVDAQNAEKEIAKAKRRQRKSRKCQRCGGELKKAGEIRAGPRGGLRNIYFCKVCGKTQL